MQGKQLSEAAELEQREDKHSDNMRARHRIGWKPYYDKVAVLLSQDVKYQQIADAVHKSRQSIHRLAQAPRMKARVAELLAGVADKITDRMADDAASVLEVLGPKRQVAAEELVGIIEAATSSNQDKIRAIIVLFKVTRDLGGEGEVPERVIAIDASVLDKYEKLTRRLQVEPEDAVH